MDYNAEHSLAPPPPPSAAPANLPPGCVTGAQAAAMAGHGGAPPPRAKGKRAGGGGKKAPRNTWRYRGGRKVYFDEGGKQSVGAVASKKYRAAKQAGGAVESSQSFASCNERRRQLERCTQWETTRLLHVAAGVAKDETV